MLLVCECVCLGYYFNFSITFLPTPIKGYGKLTTYLLVVIRFISITKTNIRVNFPQLLLHLFIMYTSNSSPVSQ